MGILKGFKDEITVNVDFDLSNEDDSTRATKLRFKCKFRRREYEDGQRLIAEVRNPDSDTTEADVVRLDLIEWIDLPGEGGDVEFNGENLEQVLTHAEYRKALFEAWGEAQLGRAMANAKN